MPRGGISFVDVRDAARAFVAALTQGNAGERYLMGAANWEFDEFFARLRQFYTDDQLVELTEIIAWENASSKFNRALRIPSQKLWKRKETPES